MFICDTVNLSLNTLEVLKVNKQPEVQILPDGRMDTKNASTYLGLSTKTLAMMRCSGTGPQFVKRGKIFYFKTDMDDWIHLGRAKSTAQANQTVCQSDMTR